MNVTDILKRIGIIRNPIYIKELDRTLASYVKKVYDYFNSLPVIPTGIPDQILSYSTPGTYT